MKLKTILPLLLVAAGLCSYVWFFDRHADSTEQAGGKSKRVLAIQASDVTRLEIKNRAHPDRSITLEKRDKNWRVVAPVSAAASHEAVTQILDAIEYLDRERLYNQKDQKESGMTVATVGLHDSQIETILLAAGKNVTLKIGKEAPIGHAVYLQADGAVELLATQHPEDIFLARNDILLTLDKPVADLRDRTIATFNPSELTRLEIRSADTPNASGRKLACAKGDGKWRLTQPITARANGSVVEELAKKIVDLRRVDFSDDAPKDLKPYGLDEPVAEISAVTAETEGAKIILFGVPVKDNPAQIYAKRKEENTVFTVPAEILQSLKAQPNDFRDKRLTDFQRDEIRAIDLETIGESVKLRHHGGWRLTSPESLPTELSVVESALELLDGLEAKEFVADVATNLADYGLDATAIHLILQKAAKEGDTKNPSDSKPNLAGTTVVCDLLFGRVNVEKHLVYVKRADEPFIYGIAEENFNQLPRTALDLRSRTVVSVNREHISAFEIFKGGKVTHLVNKAGHWDFVEANQGMVDLDVLGNILVGLSVIKAEKWVAAAPADLKGYGLDNPSVSVSFDVQEPPSANGAVPTPKPPQTYRLQIGGELPDKLFYAKLQDQPGVFLIDPVLVEQLGRPLPMKAGTPSPSPTVETK